jgi:hypothetical protein
MMKKNRFKKALVSGLVLVLALAAGLPAAAREESQAAQAPVDMKKLLAEIAGDYEFSMGAETLYVNFFEKDGKLYGSPPGETPEEILPVKDSPLKFEVTVAASGQYFALEFIRNEQGAIDKCRLQSQGIELLGTKIKKAGL